MPGHSLLHKLAGITAGQSTAGITSSGLHGLLKLAMPDKAPAPLDAAAKWLRDLVADYTKALPNTNTPRPLDIKTLVEDLRTNPDARAVPLLERLSKRRRNNLPGWQAPEDLRLLRDLRKQLRMSSKPGGSETLGEVAESLRKKQLREQPRQPVKQLPLAGPALQQNAAKLPLVRVVPAVPPTVPVPLPAEVISNTFNSKLVPPARRAQTGQLAPPLPGGTPFAGGASYDAVNAAFKPNPIPLLNNTVPMPTLPSAVSPAELAPRSAADLQPKPTEILYRLPPPDQAPFGPPLPPGYKKSWRTWTRDGLRGLGQKTLVPFKTKGRAAATVAGMTGTAALLQHLYSRSGSPAPTTPSEFTPQESADLKKDSAPEAPAGAAPDAPLAIGNAAAQAIPAGVAPAGVAPPGAAPPDVGKLPEQSLASATPKLPTRADMARVAPAMAAKLPPVWQAMLGGGQALLGAGASLGRAFQPTPTTPPTPTPTQTPTPTPTPTGTDGANNTPPPTGNKANTTLTDMLANNWGKLALGGGVGLAGLYGLSQLTRKRDKEEEERRRWERLPKIAAANPQDFLLRYPRIGGILVKAAEADWEDSLTIQTVKQAAAQDADYLDEYVRLMTKCAELPTPIPGANHNGATTPGTNQSFQQPRGR